MSKKNEYSNQEEEVKNAKNSKNNNDNIKTTTTTSSSASSSSSSSSSSWTHTLRQEAPKEVRNLLAGGTAGMMAKTIVAPVDRIKILYQVSNIHFNLRQVPRVALQIIKEEGWAALWKGNTATMFRVFPYAGIQFMSFDYIKAEMIEERRRYRQFQPKKRRVRRTTNTNNSNNNDNNSRQQQQQQQQQKQQQYNQEEQLQNQEEQHVNETFCGDSSSSITNNNNNNNNEEEEDDEDDDDDDDDSAHDHLLPWESLVAGSAAGAISVFSTYPLDLTRAQLAVLKRHKNDLQHDPGFLRVLLDNYRHGGVKGLFRGITPTLLGILPYSGIAFSTNEQAKQQIRRISGREPTTVEKMMSGALAGLAAQTITYPLEVTRRRMQTIGVIPTSGGEAAINVLAHGVGEADTGAAATAAAEAKKTKQKAAKSMIRTMGSLYREQGIRGFFKGVSMNWIKGPVAFSISFTAFDIMQGLMESDLERAERLSREGD